MNMSCGYAFKKSQTSLKNASAETLTQSAEAFAKGGDSEEHLEVSLFRLHVHHIVRVSF